MRLGCDQHQTVFTERNHFQTLGTYIAGNDADLDLAFGYGTHDLIGESLFQIDIHIRMRGQKFWQQRRNIGWRTARDGASVPALSSPMASPTT